MAKAIQISLRSIHFDRPAVHTMRGYVICLAQRNIDGEGQLYASQTSFRVRGDGKPKTRDDEVYSWQGDGELIFSTALEGLECIGLEAYFVRDNRNIRDFGTVLSDALDEDGATGKALSAVLSAAATAAGGPAAPLIALAQPAARFVGKLLAKKKDQVKIRADGSLRMTTLMHEFSVDPDGDNDIEVPWGVRKRGDGTIHPDADRGYFWTQWSLVETANPQARVVRPTLPDELIKKFNT